MRAVLSHARGETIPWSAWRLLPRAAASLYANVPYAPSSAHGPFCRGRSTRRFLLTHARQQTANERRIAILHGQRLIHLDPPAAVAASSIPAAGTGPSHFPARSTAMSALTSAALPISASSSSTSPDVPSRLP